jgi:4-diphosphocytidyl-2-C-methyl-D-erythritol kinase
MRAAKALADAAGIREGAAITLDKRLPVASGIGGGSADAAAVLRMLTSLWGIDPRHAEAVAPDLGSDVPACLLSLPARGEGAGDQLTPVKLPEVTGKPVLLVNPRVALATADVYAGWNGEDQGPLGEWREGRNDLETPAIALVPQIETVLAWLSAQPGAEFVRMSGSGATCFALFDSEEARDSAAERVPREWWRLATHLR